MKRQINAAVGCVCCVVLFVSGMGAWCSVAGAEAVAVQEQPKGKQLMGRFVTTTIQKVGERSFTGILLALPEGAGLVTVLVQPGEGMEQMLATAKQLEAGQLVRVTYSEEGERQWASEVKLVEQMSSGGEEIADVNATQGPTAETEKPADKPADEFADADSRARAKIRQLEQKVAELEAELRKMREAAAATKPDSSTKDKPAVKMLTGTTEGRVGTLIQRNVEGKSMPAVVVTVDGVPTVLVIPQIETDTGEKIYDPAVRTVVESLKAGQQVKAIWQTDGKEKMIKSIEVVPEVPTWPDFPRRRR